MVFKFVFLMVSWVWSFLILICDEIITRIGFSIVLLSFLVCTRVNNWMFLMFFGIVNGFGVGINGFVVIVVFVCGVCGIKMC